MNLLIHNRAITISDMTMDSFALRVGLLIADYTFAIGELPFCILYKEQMIKMTEANRIQAMIKAAGSEAASNILKKIVSDLKYLRGKKNKARAEIVFLKQTEKYVELEFETYLDNQVRELSKFGLSPLATLKDNEESGLKLWHIDRNKGELLTKYELSGLLSCQFNEDVIDGSDVLTLSGPATTAIHQQVAMTQLCDLPNLNNLSVNQLLSARQHLASLRKELHELIPLMPPSEEGIRYCTGSWNLDGVKQLAVRLQDAITEVPELEWTANLQKDIRTLVKVGTMDTPTLWQLLRDNDMIQDDTWEVLSKRMATGDHCAQLPIMTVTPANDTPLAHYFSEEESLLHKRKTIDLN